MLVAPILPYLTDSDDQLERLVSEISAAGATSISGIALHLRPGAREWFFGWLRREHPDLVPAYERLYQRGAYVPKTYSEDLQRRLRTIMPAGADGYAAEPGQRARHGGHRRHPVPGGGRAMITTGMPRSPAASILATVWEPPESLVSSTPTPNSPISRRSAA